MMYKGTLTPIRLSEDFSEATWQDKRERDDIFKVVEEKKKSQSKILYPAKQSFKNEGKIHSHTNKTWSMSSLDLLYNKP